MEQLGINGGNQNFPALPAGYASRDVSGSAAVLLASNEGACDLIELTGVLTGNVVVTIPIPPFPQVVGTSPPTPVFPFTSLPQALTANSWLKVIRNSTTGPFSVSVVGPGGTGIVIPQGQAQGCYSKDGVNVQSINGAGGSVIANALAAGIIYRPGELFPTGNVFATWIGVMGALGMTQGNVNIEIDDSIVSPAPALVPAAGMPAGGWDMQGRVTLTSATPIADGAHLNVVDGATLKNLAGWSQIYLSGSPGASGLPSFFYDAPNMQVSLTAATFLTQNGTRPLIDIADNTIIDVLANDFIEFLNASQGAEIFNLLGPASNLALLWTGGTTAQPATNIVAGVANASLFFYRDITSGTFTVNPARFPGGNINFFLLEGLEQKQSVTLSGVVTYVVDAAGFANGSFDETIFCKPLPVGGSTQINLPDASLLMNMGRVLRVVVTNGNAVANPIILAPFGLQLLNGLNAPVMLAGPWGTEWTAFCDGTSWTVNLDVDSNSPMANIALAASIVFRPGMPTSGNQFATWPEVMTAFGLTTGQVTIAVDDTSGIATVTPGAVYDFQSRATFVAEHQKEAPQATLNVPDTATLSNVRAVAQLLRIAATPTTTPSLAFDPGVVVFSMTDGAVIENRGTRALITEVAGSSVNVVMQNNSLYDNSVAPFPPMVDMPLGAGQSFSLTAFTGSGLLGATNTVTGVGGSQLIFQYDASWQGDPTLPLFFGAFLFSRTFDAAGFVSYDSANIFPAPTSFTAPFPQPTVQTAIDVRRSPQRTVAGNYVIDSAGLDQTIFESVDGSTITIPLSTLWPGREITVKDVSPIGGVAPFFSLGPTAADNIEGVNAPFPENTFRGSLTIKSDGAGNWWVI